MRGEYLGPRQCEYIALLAKGYTNSEIAAAMRITRAGLSTLRSRVKRLLNLPDETAIRLWASPISDKRLEVLIGRRPAAA